MQKLPNYLRTYRKRAGLSQKQVAFLLGGRSGTLVGRYENGRRLPGLRTAIAFEVAFHAPVRELFAGIYEEIEVATERRARILARKLARKAARRLLSGKGGEVRP